MPPAARATDIHVCTMADPPVPTPHVGGPIKPPCAAMVKTNNLAQARATDQLQCTGSPAPDFIVTGSTTVLIENLMAARQTDKTMHAPPGSIVVGSPDVLIGGPTGGATLGNPTAATAACNAAATGGGRTSGSLQQSYQNCGVESSRQIINQATPANISEDALLNSAMANGDADDERNRADSGGTSPGGRQAILASNGVPSSLQPQGMASIQQGVAERKGVITSHDAGRLWGTTQQGGHAVLITGVTYDANGNPQTVTYNDTGQGICGATVSAAQFNGSLRSGRDVNVTNNPIW